jgi:hypothetical protein
MRKMRNVKNKVLLTFFGMVLACCLVAQKPGDAQKSATLKSHLTLSPTELQEDFGILVATLREAHPDLYRVHSKGRIDKQIHAIERNIQTSRSYLEFLKLIAPLFTEIASVNTQWGHSPAFVEYRNAQIPLFPMELRIEGDRFFVKANYTGDSAFQVGMEVLRINGEQVKHYLRKNYVLLPIDGKMKTLPVRWLDSYFPNHHSNFWEQPSSFHLLMQTTKGVRMEMTATALLKEQIEANKLRAKAEPPLQFQIEDRIAILTLPTFDEKRMAQFDQEGFAFLDTCFSLLKTKEIEDLIINIKGAGWGSMAFGAHLYSYLADTSFTYVDSLICPATTQYAYSQHITSDATVNCQDLQALTVPRLPQDRRFEGDLYIITDGWCIDAKSFFCAKVKGRPNTRLIGEECGGNVEGIHSLAISLVLPHSDIRVSIPTAKLTTGLDKRALRKGLEVNDPFAETDRMSAVAYAKKLILRKREIIP